jgi:hypothetical protein
MMNGIHRRKLDTANIQVKSIIIRTGYWQGEMQGENKTSFV